MATIIHLKPEQVPAHLRGGYAGRQFKVEVCETVFIPSDAGLWDGGSRDVYATVELATGVQHVGGFHRLAPWDNRSDARVTLPPGYGVIRKSMSRGKDMGWTFYIRPDEAAPLLPAPVELSDHERIVLNATRSYKSSYAGRDRYQMARDNARYDTKAAAFPSRVEWDAAKSSLIARKLLNASGAITVTGRNALGSEY